MAEPGGRERAEARAGVLSASARRGGIQDEQRPDRRRAIAGAGMVATASRLLAPSQATTSAISSKIEDVAVQLSSPHMRGGLRGEERHGTEKNQGSGAGLRCRMVDGPTCQATRLFGAIHSRDSHHWEASRQEIRRSPWAAGSVSSE